jgi:hypothetical protein
MDMTLFPPGIATPAGALHAAPEGGLRSIGPQGPGGGKAARAWRSALLAAFVAIVSAACSTPEPEEKLRATIAQMEVDGEARDVSDVMDVVAEDFGGPGGMDRKQLQGMLTVITLRNQQIGVTIGPIDIEMMGERATAKFTLGASGGSGSLLPDRAQVYDITTGWKMVDGEWKLISANWKEQL